MERKHDVGGTVILVLGAVTLLATLATIGLWLFGQQVAAAIVGTAILFGWLSLFGATIAVVVSWWSKPDGAGSANCARGSDQ